MQNHNSELMMFFDSDTESIFLGFQQFFLLLLQPFNFSKDIGVNEVQNENKNYFYAPDCDGVCIAILLSFLPD